MTANQENNVMTNTDELENYDKSTDKNSNKWNWLIFLVCLLISFGVWFYTNFLDDLITTDVYLVKYELIDAGPSDYISPMYGSVRLYGPSSAFEGLESPIIIKISKSEFLKDGEYCYDVPINIDIIWPEGLHTHDANQTFTLTYKNEKPIENGTSADK